MGKWIQQVVEKRLSAPRQGLRVGKGPSPGFARPAGMGQMGGKGERGFRTRGGRLEPGLWPPGSCWHWPREKLVLSPSVKPRRKSSMSVESCAGMSCAPLSPAPKGATAREPGEEVAASFQCPPLQLRAGQCPGAGPGSRARPGLCTGCSHTQVPAGTTRTPSFTWRQRHGVTPSVIPAVAGKELGTDHHPPSSPLPSPLWRQLSPHLQGLEQVRHILGVWTLLQGAQTPPWCQFRAQMRGPCTDDPSSIRHIPVTNVHREGACPQN